MRWAHAAVVLAVPSLLAALPACGSSVEESTGGSGGQATQGTGGGNGGSAGQGGHAGGVSTNSGGSGQGGAEVYPAPHPPPVTVRNLGGPIMSAQKIVPVFWGNDDGSFVSQVNDFLARVGTSTYFAAFGAEYGVGPATVLPPVQLADSATGTITDDQIQAWLIQSIETDALLPPADDQTIYVLFYPAGVTITDFGGTSCQSFGGYHFNTNLTDGTPAIYAVIPRCPGGQGETALDLVTSSTSHELLEAATDPLPYQNPAYGAVDNAHFYWELTAGAEVGDLCALSPSGFSKYPDMPYMVQRGYSNEAALAGHQPCIPATPGAVYFNAAPVPKDDIAVFGPSGTIKMRGVRIPVGQEETIDVDLFSDAPTGAWNLEVFDANALFGLPPDLELSLDKDKGSNGDVLKLHIKVLHQGQYGLEPYVIYSIKGKEANVWAGVVSQ